jgi:hypothetical protein
MPIDLTKTSGTSPPRGGLGDFPAHLFTPEPVASGPTTYHITDDLWSAYSREQLALQTKRLKSTDRYRLPSGEFIVRLFFETVVDMERYVARNPGYVPRPDLDSYFDFHYVGDELTGIDQVVCFRYPEFSVSAEWRLRALANFSDPMSVKDPDPFDLSGMVAWWDSDHVIACRLPVIITRDDGKQLAEDLGDEARDLLACLLYDRSIYRVESEPRNQPHRHKNLLGPSAQQRVQQITMYVPRRVSTADHGGTHASPKMHFRAEHTRQQPHGPRSNPSYREIVIAGKWINAADIDPSELGTPQRTVVLRGI